MLSGRESNGKEGREEGRGIEETDERDGKATVANEMTAERNSCISSSFHSISSSSLDGEEGEEEEDDDDVRIEAARGEAERWIKGAAWRAK